MVMKLHLGFFTFATIMVSVSSKTTHVVGDSSGWSTPHTDPGFYANWAKSRNFVVGDVLFFKYHPGLNTVVQVKKNDYDNCSTRETISIFVKGNTNFTLDTVGDYFFISSVGKRCEAGQKLWVTVSQGKQKPSAV